MSTTMRLIAALALAALPFISAEPTQLKLFHRLFHPSAGTTPYAHRATLFIDKHNTLSFQLAPSFADDLTTFGDVLRSATQEAHLALYQVALERSGDKTEAEWDISSVKACHLLQASSETIHLHTLDPHNPKPYALDYFIAPIPHDGACQAGRYKGTAEILVDTNPFHAFANNMHRLNTTVTFRGSSFPPLPELAAPPPLSAEGEPVVHLPEKTFLEKYWMYIVGFVMLTLLTGAGEEDKEKPKS